MSDITPIIIVAVLGVIGNIAYFEYRLKKEHRKETVKEQLTKLLLPLYIILKTDELEFLVWQKNQEVDIYEYESDKPDRLLNPIKNILNKNLYLADDELQMNSLLFMKWAYGENTSLRYQEIHCGDLDQDKIFDDFRKLVYKKYDEQRKKYLK